MLERRGLSGGAEPQRHPGWMKKTINPPVLLPKSQFLTLFFYSKRENYRGPSSKASDGLLM